MDRRASAVAEIMCKSGINLTVTRNKKKLSFGVFLFSYSSAQEEDILIKMKVIGKRVARVGDSCPDLELDKGPANRELLRGFPRKM